MKIRQAYYFRLLFVKQPFSDSAAGAADESSRVEEAAALAFAKPPPTSFLRPEIHKKKRD